MSSAPGTNTAIFWFFLITTLYFPLQNAFYIVPNEGNNNTTEILYILIYIILVTIIQYFINLNISNKICDEVQWGSVLSITLLPWVFVFLFLIIFLINFPGWLKPFSNTFGYGIVSMMGIQKLFTDILKSSNSENNKELNENLAKIYSDKSLLINEISYHPEEFIDFWNHMTPLMKIETKIKISDLTPKHKYDEGKEYQKLAYELFTLVRIKYLIAEYIWYLLGGTLAIMISYSYIINSGCKLSAKEIEKRHKDMVAQEKEFAEKKKKENPRIYKNYGG
tara:strand:- start:10013 stop:10849 length:837 start_codon:yes stop_codon:yes gene_type:complete